VTRMDIWLVVIGNILILAAIAVITWSLVWQHLDRLTTPTGDALETNLRYGLRVALQMLDLDIDEVESRHFTNLAINMNACFALHRQRLSVTPADVAILIAELRMPKSVAESMNDLLLLPRRTSHQPKDETHDLP
jgi:hypothetical protein